MSPIATQAAHRYLHAIFVGAPDAVIKQLAAEFWLALDAKWRGYAGTVH
jgi:hypothetical protein